jgi:hypothetical protein
MVKLPWKKTNARAQQIAAEFERLVALYRAELSNANRNAVARRINRAFTANVNRRRNKATTAKAWSNSGSNSPRSTRIAAVRSPANTWMRNSRNASVNVRYNARLGWPRGWLNVPTNSRHMLSRNLAATRYAPRSTNERIVY